MAASKKQRPCAHCFILEYCRKHNNSSNTLLNETPTQVDLRLLWDGPQNLIFAAYAAYKDKFDNKNRMARGSKYQKDLFKKLIWNHLTKGPQLFVEKQCTTIQSCKFRVFIVQKRCPRQTPKLSSPQNTLQKVISRENITIQMALEAPTPELNYQESLIQLAGGAST